MLTKFENLSKNPLDGAMVSISRKIEYADINIERMTKNNPDGSNSPLIDETKQKRDAFAGNLSSSKMNEAIRIAYTAELAKTALEFRNTVSKFEGLVKSVFGKGSSIYLMFFAYGLEEYHKANQAQLPMLMDKMMSLNLTYKSELGTTMYYDLFNVQKMRYTNAFSLQKQAGGTVSNTKAAKEMLWNELKKQLYKNMLTLVLNNIDHPAMMLSYFEPRLLRFRHHKTENETEDSYILTLAANTTEAASISFSVNDQLLILNNGEVPVYYYGAATATEAPKTVPVEIAAGEEVEVTAASLGAPANKFLLFINKDLTTEAEVEVMLL